MKIIIMVTIPLILVIEWLHKQLNEEALHRPMPSALPSYGISNMPMDYEKYKADKPDYLTVMKN